MNNSPAAPCDPGLGPCQFWVGSGPPIPFAVGRTLVWVCRPGQLRWGRCRAFQTVMFRLSKTKGLCRKTNLAHTELPFSMCLFRVFSKVGWFGWVVGSPGRPPGLGSDFKYFASRGSAGVGSAIALEAPGNYSPSSYSSLVR